MKYYSLDQVLDKYTPDLDDINHMRLVGELSREHRRARVALLDILTLEQFLSITEQATCTAQYEAALGIYDKDIQELAITALNVLIKIENFDRMYKKKDSRAIREEA